MSARDSGYLRKDRDAYDSAFNHASDDERALALVYLEDWLKGPQRLVAKLSALLPPYVVHLAPLSGQVAH